MPFTKLSASNKKTILTTARHAVQYGLKYSKAPTLELSEFSETLVSGGRCFVTLKETNRLRGCIGSLEVRYPLIQDVANNAFSAAFEDPRFPPVNRLEEPLIHISISILSDPEPLRFASQEELLSLIRPGIDGLVLEYENHRATYLPSVWQQLPEPECFLSELKKKAGLAKNFWEPALKCSRYTTTTID